MAVNQPRPDNPTTATGHSQQYEPPDFLRFRALLALNNLPVSQPLIAEGFADLEGLLELIDGALGWAYDSPPDHWFPNNMAAVGLLTRAYQGIQAAAHLCLFGFYVEARATLRGVYESAGLARTLAHRIDFAERWLHGGEWFKDNVSRQFVQSASEQRVAHSDHYKQMSQHAHPLAVSTFGYLFTRDMQYRPSAYPLVDREEFEECARYITAVALFVCWAFRKATADPAALPGWWHKRLTELAVKITGDPHDHLDKDWEAHQRRHEALYAELRHSDELEEALEADPNSLLNRRRRQAAEDADQ